jgi:hypothetical protein
MVIATERPRHKQAGGCAVAPLRPYVRQPTTRRPGDLKPGVELQTPSGSAVTVSAVKTFMGEQDRRNLTISHTHTYYVVAKSTPLLVHNCDGYISWVPENANVSAGAAAYDAGAVGSRTGYAPALDYINADRSTLGSVKFDGFDKASGVLIDRKVSVTTFVKTY